MMKKKAAILFLIIVGVVLMVCPGSEALTVAAADLPAAVFLNGAPGPIIVTKPAPVNLPTFILGGQWTSKPFELYVFTGDGAGSYMGSDFGWHTYDSQHLLQPVLSTAMPDYQDLVLPSFVNLYWSPFSDTSTLPEGNTLLTVCIDNVLDGALMPADSSCGSVDIYVQKPVCILSLSKKVIQQTITEGQNAQQETITVSDTCGSGSFSAAVLEGGDWISAQGGTAASSVTFNASGLLTSEQPYQGRIQVTSEGGATDYISVSLTVNPKSACTTLTASPASVNFSGSKNVLFPIVEVSNSPATVVVKDCSGAQMSNFTVSTDNQGWLSATKNADGSITVSAIGSKVSAAGTYRGNVIVTAAGFATLTIPVTLTVTGGSTGTTNCNQINLSPSYLTFSGAAGALSSAQTVSVTDSCGSPKSFSASPSASWIKVTPTSGSGRFDVTVTMPSVTTSGSITVNVGGVSYTVSVTATPSGPACTTPTKIQLYNASGGAASSLNVSGSTSGVVSQTVSVRDDCSQAVTNYTIASYQVASAASCTAQGIQGAAAPTWMTVTQSSSTVNIAFPSPAIGSYSGCVVVNSGSLTPAYLPITLSVTDAPPVGVTQLTSAVTRRLESVGARQGKIYSAMHATSSGKAAFSVMTRDWVTDCDMIVMYSGATCGSRLPDVNDYNAIIADIRSTGLNMSQTGKVFNGQTFYYQILGQNESVTANGAQQGCYYIYIFNTSNATATYDVLFTDIQ